MPPTSAPGSRPTCRPAMVVFPFPTGRPESVLRRVDADQALLELAPNVLLTETGRAQAHLDPLAELARSVPCYRLQSGCDLAQTSELLVALIHGPHRWLPVVEPPPGSWLAGDAGP